MVNTDAKYCRPCLVKLNNKYRDFKRRKLDSEYQGEFAQGMYTLLFTLYTLLSIGRVRGTR